MEEHQKTVQKKDGWIASRSTSEDLVSVDGDEWWRAEGNGYEL